MIDVPSPPNDAIWVKATASNSGGCVEVAQLAGFVWVRDSKDRDGPVLGFHRFEWVAFLEGVAAGEFRSRTSAGARAPHSPAP